MMEVNVTGEWSATEEALHDYKDLAIRHVNWIWHPVWENLDLAPNVGLFGFWTQL